MRRHFGQLLCYLVPGLWLSGQFLLPSPSLFFPCFVPLARNLETLATEAKFYFLFCCVSSAKVKNGHRCFGKPEGFQDATNVFPTKWSHPRNGRKHSFGRIHFAGTEQWSSSQQFFGGVVICQLFSQALFVLSRSLFFQKSENLLLVKISKHFAFEKIWKLAIVYLSHVLSTTSYGLLRPPSSKDSVQPGEVKETPKSKRKRCFFWIISDFQKTNSDFRKQDLIFKTDSNFRKPTLIFKNKLHFRKIKLWFCSVKQLCTLTKPPKSIVTGVTEGHARLIFAPAKRAAHWPIKSRNFFPPEVYC